MKPLDNTLAAFEKYLDNISDSKLDKMLEEIDQMGIGGPSVEEYFSALSNNITSFFNELSETSTIVDVEKLFCDTRISESQSFKVPHSVSEDFCSPELSSPQSSFYAGETQYLMAA